MEYKQATNAQNVTPLETLIVHQLAEVLRAERQLEEQYRQLGRELQQPETIDEFSKELSKIGEKANRLYRLVEAMEGLSSEGNPAWGSFHSLSPQ